MSNRRLFLKLLAVAVAQSRNRSRSQGLIGGSECPGVRRPPASAAPESPRSSRCCPKEGSYAERFAIAPRCRLRGDRDADRHPRGRGRRDQRGGAEDRASSAFGDERRALAVAALEQRPRSRQPQRPRNGDVDPQCCAVGIRHRPTRSRRCRREDVVPRCLDALRSA